jgi:hypothetical protein
VTIAYSLNLEAIFDAAGWKAIRRLGTYRSGDPPPVFVLHFGRTGFLRTTRSSPSGRRSMPPASSTVGEGPQLEPGGLVIYLPPKPKK